MTQSSLAVHRESQPVGNMPNASTINRLHRMLDEMIAEHSKKGQYGEATLTYRYADGIIQAKSVTGETSRKFIID